MNRRLSRWLLATTTTLAMALAMCRIASAQPIQAVPVSSQPLPPPPSAPTWYGGQIVLADAAALTLLIAGGLTERGEIAWAGIATYVLAAPAVHLAHDNEGNGGVSFFLRLAAPVAAGAIGFKIEESTCGPDTWFCGLGGMIIGALTGALTASAVDALVLARTPGHPAFAERVSRARSVTPTLAMSRDGDVAFGLAGRF